MRRSLGESKGARPGYLFQVDVVPDIELSPVGEGEDADAFAGVDARVIDVPQLGALVFGVPLAGTVTEGEDALFGAGFFFIAAGPSEGGVEAMGAQAVEQRGGLEQSAAAASSQRRSGLAPSASAASFRHTSSCTPRLRRIVVAKGESSL